MLKEKLKLKNICLMKNAEETIYQISIIEGGDYYKIKEHHQNANGYIWVNGVLRDAYNFSLREIPMDNWTSDDYAKVLKFILEEDGNMRVSESGIMLNNMLKELNVSDEQRTDILKRLTISYFEHHDFDKISI